ncbi:Cache 3/Cache 2 fusion domain-containing protein [Fusibacter ferrireducens]|uniref:histidine kinase n=1 Tax=Fusibacter ferrireducens TaxID=2785058 RepID=A0ABR9ZYQ2_9FIRM|nr:Cache 3/Cache 2 fusion domain-containing protein [Fusibacter ferrireducens]MBF4695585.1 methyl-accepting chemotaxis protein [Fusibacter ferrireducens]
MNPSFRMRLFKWFVIVSVIPSILLGGFSYLLINQEIAKNTENMINNTNDGIYNMIDTQQRVLDQWLPSAAEAFVSQLNALGESRFDYNEMVKVGDYVIPTWYIGDQKITHDYTLVDELIEKEKLPATIFMLEDNKFLRVSTNVRQEDGSRIIDTDISSGPIYDKIINGQVYLGRASVEGIMHATIYMPIFDSDRKLIGAFVLGRRESEYEIINAIKRITIANNGYVMIMDSDANIIIHPERTGENVMGYEWIQSILKQQNGSIRYSFDGTEKIAYFRYYEPWDWYIVSIGILDDIQSAPRTMLKLLLTTFIISILISLLIAYFISKEFFKPINKLVNSLKLMKNGDLSVRFTSYKDEEFKFLSNTFNALSYTFSILMGRLISSSNKLKESSKRVLLDLDRSMATLSNLEKDIEDLMTYPIKLSSESNLIYLNVDYSNDMIESLELLRQKLPKYINASNEEVMEIITLIDDLKKQIDVKNEATVNHGDDMEINNRFNAIYIEIQKLKLLIDNIVNSSSSLDEIATEVDKQVNIFKTENDPYIE